MTKEELILATPQQQVQHMHTRLEKKEETELEKRGKEIEQLKKRNREHRPPASPPRPSQWSTPLPEETLRDEPGPLLAKKEPQKEPQKTVKIWVPI